MDVRTARRMVALATIAAAAFGVTGAASSSSGNVWRSLQRPFHLPRLGPGGACPVTSGQRVVKIESQEGVGYGRGPTYPIFPYTPRHAALALPEGSGGPWTSQSLRWFALREQGSVLIRGRSLAGAQRIRFGRAGSLQLKFRWGGVHRTLLHFRGGGCYGLQIDGSDYSHVVVFQVAAPSANTKRLVDALRGVGLPLELANVPRRPWLFGVSERYAVSREAPEVNVGFWEFVDDQAARNAAEMITPDGSGLTGRDGGVLIEWAAPPHWFRTGAVLAVSVGSDERTLGLLTQVLGPQFAGM